MSKIRTEYFFKNQVWKITLNAPKGNILDGEMMVEILDVLIGLEQENDVKLLIFQGAGEHFSFGASVKEHQKEQVGEMLNKFHSIFYNLIDLSIPTAVLVSGQCLGGGMELATFCNFIFVDRTARFGQPEIRLGVFPPLASIILPLKIGSSKADDLLLTGRSISAEEAKTIGLVNKIFDTKEVMESEVNSWIEKGIIPKSASSLRFGVKADRKLFNDTIKKELPEVEVLYVEELMATYDANEGIEAFLEKRDPAWKNR